MTINHSIKRALRGIRRGWLTITGARTARYFYIRFSRQARCARHHLAKCDAELALPECYHGQHAYQRGMRTEWLRMYKNARDDADKYLSTLSPARRTPLR